MKVSRTYRIEREAADLLDAWASREGLTASEAVEAAIRSRCAPRAPGRPTKRDAVREYAAAHPEARHRQIARALEMSPTTVIKWLKEEA